MTEKRPPPILDYGHDEDAVRRAARIALRQAEQGQLNTAFYWLWYYGGPRYVSIAAVAGLVPTVLLVWLCHWHVTAFALGVGWCVTAAVVALRPHRHDW